MEHNLEYVPGDNLVKQFIPVDSAEHSRWMSTWSDSSYACPLYQPDAADGQKR